MRSRPLLRHLVVAAVVTATAGTTAGTMAAGAPPDDVSGEYLLVRRVTEDDGWFGLVPGDGTYVHEARTYDITADGSELSITSRYFGEDASMASDPFAGTATDGTIAYVNEILDACLSTASGEYDGPDEALLRSVLEVSATDLAGVFAGDFSYRAVTAASDDCEPEDIGYVAVAHLVDLDAVDLVAAVPGTYGGQFVRDDQPWATEYAVRDCEPAEGCDIIVRFAQDNLQADGSTVERFIDVYLLEGEAGGYHGGASYVSGCRSDLDGSFVADEVYRVTIAAEARFYDLGDDVAFELLQGDAGDPLDKLPSTVAAQCGGFSSELHFVGLPTGDEHDWSVEPYNPIVR